MHRHPLILLLIAPAVLLLSVAVAPAAEPEAAKPNIIFILADDLGYGDLGSYGQEVIQTPTLDRMAAEGMKFSDFYAGSTVCAPSRSVLMTGQHTGHTPIRGNARVPLEPGDITVAEVLREAGYATGLVGKWGLGEPDSTGIPTRQGFDYFFGYLNQRHAHNYYPAYLWRNEERVELDNEVPGEGRFGRGYASRKVDYSHDLFAEEALQFVDDHKDEPFFLYLALTIPHANNEGNRGTGDGQEVPDYGIYEEKDWPKQDKGQAAMITRMDGDISRLLERLEEHGIDENTLVMFSSDNGHHNEGGHNPERFDPNGPLRGMKRDLYEGGIRVPFIARWPGQVEAGSTSDHVAYFGDLMATAADLAGVEPPDNIDSISFLPTLLGNPDEQEEHDYLYWEFYERGSKQAVRMDNWKAVRMPMHDGEIELYDVSEDLGEANDVAEEHPEVVDKMKAIMDEAHTPDEQWQPRGNTEQRQPEPGTGERPF